MRSITAWSSISDTVRLTITVDEFRNPLVTTNRVANSTWTGLYQCGDSFGVCTQSQQRFYQAINLET